jgi:glutaredoxin
MQNHQVTIITLPLCPKCVIMKKRLHKIAEDQPEITIEETGLQAYIGEAMKRRIMDAPIILVGDRVFSGVVDDSAILSALGI